MGQKTILNFFGGPKPKPTPSSTQNGGTNHNTSSSTDNSKSSSSKSKDKKNSTKKEAKSSRKTDVEDSPIKSTPRRRAVILDSDSEDEDSNNQLSPTDVDEDEKENRNGETNASDKDDGSEDDSNSNNDVNTNSSLTKFKSSNIKDKLKKFEASEFTELNDRPVKQVQKIKKKDSIPAKPDEKKEKKDSIPVKPVEKTGEVPSSSNSNKANSTIPGFTEDTVPPRRITAKKNKKRKSTEVVAGSPKKRKCSESVKDDSLVEEEPMDVGSQESNSDNDLDKVTSHKDTSPKKEPLSPKSEKETPEKASIKESTSPKKKAFNNLFSPKTSSSKPIASVKKETTSPKKETSDEDNKQSDDENYSNKSGESTDVKKEESNKSSIPGPTKIGINPFAPKSTSPDPGVDYNPTKSKYHPINDAFWKRGEKVPYLALAKTLEKIEATSGRLKTIEILANLIRSVIVLSPDDLLHCIYLCLNKVAPAFTGIELMVGDTILMKVIAQTTGRSMGKIKADIGELGDVGIVAEQSKSNQRMMMQPAKLTVNSVFTKLKDIASMTGTSSQNKKVDKIKGMFVACRHSEARYLIRSLTGKLRIGLAEQSVLQAIGQACYLTPPNQEYPHEVLDAGKGLAAETLKSRIEEKALIVKTTYCECPSYDQIVPILLTKGVAELPNYCKLSPGMPLKPMLAHPTKGVSEVLKRFENAKFTCEYKYDGERAQIHLHEDGTINIYSRNQEDNTSKYPDIISRLRNSLGEGVTSCVIDSEAVAWDKEKKQILPFQILSTRKRKDANESEIKVQVCVFPFDLLYFNGKSLVRETFEYRRKLLKENFIEVEGELVFAKSMDSTDIDDIQEFLDESIKGNCEGLMVKTLDIDSTYEIAKRSHNWLKVKKDYLDGVGDTLDLVVLGGYLGKGKRAGHYGGFLLGCHDPDNEEFQSICKIGTGFSDEDLQKHSAFFKEHIIEKPKSYYRYDNGLSPDHWFDAVQVWEIKCADLSISPVHKAAAGLVDPEKGISLRFPRFLRIREDKTAEEATSASQVADLYNSQDQIKNKTADKNDEDFY